MNCLKAFGDRALSQEPDRQAADIPARIAILNRCNALGFAEFAANACAHTGRESRAELWFGRRRTVISFLMQKHDA